MDDIRKNILHEQEVRKARLNAYFEQSFSANGTVNENGRDTETTATKSADEVHKEVKRQSSIIKAVEVDGVDEALDILKGAGTEDLFEKAKHQDGDMHPNGKWVWVASAAGGKGDWRTAGGRAHKTHQAGAAAGSGSTGTENKEKKKENLAMTSAVKNKETNVSSNAKYLKQKFETVGSGNYQLDTPIGGGQILENDDDYNKYKWGEKIIYEARAWNSEGRIGQVKYFTNKKDAESYIRSEMKKNLEAKEQPKN